MSDAPSPDSPAPSAATAPASPDTGAATPDSEPALLLQALEGVRTELATWNALQQWAFSRPALRALLMQFLKGTAFGLGSLVGATIVLSTLLYFLSRMEVIPVLGEWIHQITQQINRPTTLP